MVRVAQPSGGETTFEKDLPRSPRTIRVSQPSGGKTTFDKELPRSPRTVRVSQPSGGKTTFEDVPFPDTRLRVLKPPGGGSSISFGGDEQVHPSKTTSPTATAPHENNKSNGTVQNGNHINGQSPTTNGTCNGTMSNGSMTPNGSCTTASSPGSAKSIDTQNRLFGGSEHSSARERNDTPTKPSSKPTKLRDHMRSSIFGDDSGTPSRNSTPNGTVHSSKAPPKDLPSKVKPEAHNSFQQDSPKTEKPFPEINKTDSKQTDPSVTTKSDTTTTKVPEEAPSIVTDAPKPCVDLPKPEITITEKVVSQNNGTPSGAETSVKETPEPPKPASAPAAQPQQKQRVPPGGFSTALW